MNANELRIGSLVYYETIDLTNCNDIAEIISIQPDDIKSIHLKGLGHEKYHPIPIAGDWLLKFGFEKRKTQNADLYLIDLIKIGRNPALKKLCLYFESRESEWIVCFLDYYTGKEVSEIFPNNILYVHQLQNLFFALTGKELELK